MAINDEILTQEKLEEFNKVSDMEYWEECKNHVDGSIFGEMDWYLIHGLLDDYLDMVSKNKSKRFEKVLKRHTDGNQTLEKFKELANSYEYVDKELEVYEEGLITVGKLYQYQTLIDYGDWDEVKHLANEDIIKEADWYIISELMTHYVAASQLSKYKHLLPEIETSLKSCCNTEQTVGIFKEIAKEMKIDQE